jgi:hypothetical protein
MKQEIDMYSYKHADADPFTENNSPFSKIEDYEIDVPCLNKNEKIKYLFRSYCFRDYLYITDIFPSMWEGQDDCFKRIISREGYSVNMRKLSVTCLAIFAKHYMAGHINNAMVISGSYEYGEDDSNVSRKLRLYWAFFSPLLEKLFLRAIQIRELNAFVLINKNSCMEDCKIIKDYSDFKNNKRQLQDV